MTTDRDPAAPPPVPEDVRRLSEAYDQARDEWWRIKSDVAAPYGASYGAQIALNTAQHAFMEASAKWVRTLLATPAPPADNGRLWAIEASGPSLKKQLSEARQEIDRLREALRPFAIRMPPGRHDADFYRPLDPFSRVGDHRRADQEGRDG